MNIVGLIPSLSTKLIPHTKVSRCLIHRWVAPLLHEMYRRRKKLGPEPERPRSSWLWNANAELYAFGKRLNEPLNFNLLRQVFTHKSYVIKEEQSRKELGLSDVPLILEFNESLQHKGQQITDDYIMCYLRMFFSKLPEEGIEAIKDYLTSDKLLAHVSSNIGTKDLIFCEEFPPSERTLADTLKAFIGALAEERDQKAAEVFVQDFILTQLIGKDVNEMWEIVNPMGILMDILKREGRELPESRLIREAGRNTIFAVYNVGLYSSRKVLGIGAGETLQIAEEMAARDALKRLFNTRMEPIHLVFGKAGHSLNIPRNTRNLSVNEWSSKILQQMPHRNV